MSSNQNLDTVAGDEQSAAALDNLMDTPQEYDPEANNDVSPPPPPERPEGYDVLVRLQERTDNEGQAKPPIYAKAKDGKPYLVLALEVAIDAPGERYDGYRISDWQTSLINKETGSSGILNFCRIMGEPMPRGLSPNQQIQYLEGVFNAERQIAGIPLRARIRWEASYKQDDGSYSKAFIRGMNRFPQKFDEQGNVIGHEHVVDNPAGGDPVTAQVRIARYMAREEQAEGQSA